MSNQPPLKTLIDEALTRADWLRLIRRIAHSGDLASIALLLRYRHGAPNSSAQPLDAGVRRLLMLIPSNGLEAQLPPLPADSETGQQALSQLIDEALTPRDWAIILRRISHSGKSRGASILMRYRYGTLPTKPVSANDSLIIQTMPGAQPPLAAPPVLAAEVGETER